MTDKIKEVEAAQDVQVDIKPTIDPDSPAGKAIEASIERLQKAIKGSGTMDRLAASLKSSATSEAMKSIDKATKALAKSFSPITSNPGFLAATRNFGFATKALQELANSPGFKALQEYAREAKRQIDEHKAVYEAAGPRGQELLPLAVYIYEELVYFYEERNPGETAPAIESLFECEFDADGLPIGQPWRGIVEAAREKYNQEKAADSSRDIEQLEADVEAVQVVAQQVEALTMPLDKISHVAFNDFENTNGQIKLKAERDQDSGKMELNILFSLDFDALPPTVRATKKLTPTDKRIQIAIAALKEAGNDVISLNQIHKATGNTGKPSSSQIKKYRDSIIKQIGGRISIDNSQEAALYNYPKFTYTGPLLPVEMITAEINGQLTNEAIHIFREPPIITFAKGRKQVTTIKMEVLQSPISKTDANLRIDDYLLERIARAKNGGNNRILYKTIYENAGITTAKQKQRAPEKILKYMDHYKASGFIESYHADKAGITVIV